MDKWYKAKEGCSIQHAGEIIEADKKIFLPEDLAALHNSLGEQLVVTTEPTSLEEVAIKAEWDYLQEQKASKTTTSNSSTTATAT